VITFFVDIFGDFFVFFADGDVTSVDFAENVPTVSFLFENWVGDAVDAVFAFEKLQIVQIFIRVQALQKPIPQRTNHPQSPENQPAQLAARRRRVSHENDFHVVQNPVVDRHCVLLKNLYQLQNTTRKHLLFVVRQGQLHRNAVLNVYRNVLEVRCRWQGEIITRVQIRVNSSFISR
jgi:hypothetical protein